MTSYQEALEAIASAEVGSVRRDEPLADHCTWRIGGPADLLVEPATPEQVAAVLRLVRAGGVPVVVLGEGSNLLFDDAGVRGVVLKIGSALSRFSIEGARIRVQAGVTMPALAREAAQAGLTGLEHTCGIPGTLGGLVVMNGGSLGQNIGDVVTQVEAVSREGELKRLPREACGFAYRRSGFQRSGDVVVGAELECRPGDPERIEADMRDILLERQEKHPLDWPNCGSVFKNAGEMLERFGPAGKVIAEAGLKGLRVGQAEVSSQHANFIINTGGARSADVLELIGRIQKVVFEQTQLWMECEVRYVAPTGGIASARSEADHPIFGS